MKLRDLKTPEAEKLADRIEGKAVVPTALKSADIEKIPAEIYTRSFISAGVENARWLSDAQKKLGDALAQRKERVANGEAYVTRSSFVADMRRAALESGMSDGTGTITDVASPRRIRLMHDMQTRSAAGYTKWQRDRNSRGIQIAFPAQELVRIQPRNMMRDWPAIWVEKGGKLYDGRMVALKDDPIWTEISRFGTPWAPFDYGSGMGTRDVSRREAIALGLIESDYRPDENSPDVGFNDDYEADVSELDSDFVQALTDLFGTLVQLRGNTLAWRSDS